MLSPESASASLTAMAPTANVEPPARQNAANRAANVVITVSAAKAAPVPTAHATPDARASDGSTRGY